jgi:hypothetical protein
MTGDIVTAKDKKFMDDMGFLPTTKLKVTFYGKDHKDRWMFAIKSVEPLASGKHEGHVIGYYNEFESEGEMVTEFEGTFNR